MKATTYDIAVDMAAIFQGKALYDYKGDRVYYVTDPFLNKMMKVILHEIAKTEPISVSVFRQARRREESAVLAAIQALTGTRPTKSEEDIRRNTVLRNIYSLRGQQEELYQYLDNIMLKTRKTTRLHGVPNGWGIRRGGGDVLVLTRYRIALKSRRLNALVRCRRLSVGATG